MTEEPCRAFITEFLSCAVFDPERRVYRTEVTAEIVEAIREWLEVVPIPRTESDGP